MRLRRMAPGLVRHLFHKVPTQVLAQCSTKTKLYYLYFRFLAKVEPIPDIAIVGAMDLADMAFKFFFPKLKIRPPWEGRATVEPWLTWIIELPAPNALISPNEDLIKGFLMAVPNNHWGIIVSKLETDQKRALGAWFDQVDYKPFEVY